MASTDDELEAKLAARRQKASTDDELQAKLQARRAAKEKAAPRSGAPSLGAKDSTPSTSQALGAGAAQGATLGFGDEIEGLVQAIGNKLTGYHNHESNPPSFVEDYTRERDAARAQNHRDDEAHPVAYTGGEIGGSVNAAPFGVGRGLAASVKAGGALGALFGVGHSEAEPGSKEAEADLRRGAAIGAAAAPIGYAGGKLVAAGARKGGDVLRGLSELFGRVPKANLDRAAETLGAKVGVPSSDPLVADALESGAVDKFPPSILNRTSDKASSALAGVASHPEVKAAEEIAKQGIRSSAATTKAAAKALKAPAEIPSELRELAAEPGQSRDWARSALKEKEAALAQHAATTQNLAADIQLLSDIAARKLPAAGSINTFFNSAAQKLGPVGRSIQRAVEGNQVNLARVLSDPAKTRELAMLIAAGRSPNLAADATKALSARAMTLMSAAPQD